MGIFEPVEIGGLRLKNRLVRSATWEGIAAPDGGIDASASGHLAAAGLSGGF